MNSDDEVQDAEMREESLLTHKEAITNSEHNVQSQSLEQCSLGSTISPCRKNFQKLRLTTLQEELQFVYDFVQTRSKKELETLLRDDNIRRPATGKISVLRARLMLHVLSESERNIMPLTVVEAILPTEVNVHLRVKKNGPMKSVPPVSLLLDVLPEKEQASFRRMFTPVVLASAGESGGATSRDVQSVVSVGEKSASLDFTEDEFARLLLLIRDDDDAKKQISTLATTISREQQDSGIRRDDLWERIAKRFNDPRFVPSQNFPDPLCNVCPGLVPLAKRTGQKLANVWRENTRIWTEVVGNYNVSGNNGELPFKDFCHVNARTKELSAVGRRTLITYVVYGLDFVDVDRVVGQFMTRSLPSNAGGSLGVARNLKNVLGRKRRFSSGGDGSQASKRTKSQRSSSDDVAYEVLSGINSSMNRFATGYERRVDIHEKEYHRREKSSEDHFTSGAGSSSLQDTMKYHSSLMEATRMLEESNEKYQDAKRRGCDPAHISSLKKVYESFDHLVKTLLADVAEKTNERK